MALGAPTVFGSPSSNRQQPKFPNATSGSEYNGTGAGWGAANSAFGGQPITSQSQLSFRNRLMNPNQTYDQANQFSNQYSQGPAPYDTGTAIPGYLGSIQNSQNEEQNLRANYGFDNRDLDTRLANLGIDRGANDRDKSYYQNLLNVLGERRNIVGAQFNNQVQGLQNTAADSVRNTNSAATAGGGWFGPRRMTDVGNAMTRDYNLGVSNADLNRRSSLQGLFEQQLGYERSLAGTGDADAKFDILAKQFGTDRERLTQGLDHGLDQLGYSRFVSKQDLLDKLAMGGQVGEAAQKILQDAYQQGSTYQNGAYGDEYLRAGGRS